jgi:hypothetical protein
LSERPIALFDIERSIALYNFFSGKGDRDPFTTFSRVTGEAAADRTFSIERSIAHYDFFTGGGSALFGILQ